MGRPASVSPAARQYFCSNSEDGAISGWNPAFGTGSTAIVAVDHGSPNPSLSAVYKGLAISSLNGGTLYATNFRAGTVEAYNTSFNPVLTGGFVDTSLPAGFAPFNDEVINGDLYVTYAKQDAAKHDDVAGLGNGFVDVFNLDGTGEHRLISNGLLDLPWGMAIAPSSFGSFAGDLLVGNFGNGEINAYNATTGTFIGTLDGADGNPLVIDGLWALTIGNGAAGGSLNTLYFTAGPDGESHGLFGSLAVVPELSTWAMMLADSPGLAWRRIANKEPASKRHRFLSNRALTGGPRHVAALLRSRARRRSLPQASRIESSLSTARKS